MDLAFELGGVPILVFGTGLKEKLEPYLVSVEGNRLELRCGLEEPPPVITELVFKLLEAAQGVHALGQAVAYFEIHDGVVQAVPEVAYADAYVPSCV